MERTYQDQEGDDLVCIMGRLLVLRLVVRSYALGSMRQLC